ncbi:MAG: flavodoxin family protein [Candidatus Woesearchaeota archaeon]
MKVTIIYDTRSGNTEKMAQSVKEGIDLVEGITGIAKKVEEASADDLLESEGLIVGSPTHCGLLSWKLKKFFDSITKEAWSEVKGKIGTAFATSGGLGGGNEMAVLSILNLLMNYGYLVFGLPDYAAPEVTAHYGAVAVGEPDQDELKSCRMLGQQMAEYVKKMNE